jgi:hypothetical protein
MRSAKYTLLDQAARGDWRRFVHQDFPRSEERWEFSYHNFLQLICVKKAPFEVFQKYLPRMKDLINKKLPESGSTPLHLLLGKDYFNFPGNPPYEVTEDDLVNTVRYLIENGADLTSKNDRSQTPLEVALKNPKMFSSVVQLLKNSTNAY